MSVYYFPGIVLSGSHVFTNSVTKPASGSGTLTAFADEDTEAWNVKCIPYGCTAGKLQRWELWLQSTCF